MRLFRSNNEMEKENVELKRQNKVLEDTNRILNETVRAYKEGGAFISTTDKSGASNNSMEVADKAKEIFKEDTRSFMCKLFNLSPNIETYNMDFEPCNIFSIVLKNIDLICGVREDYFGLNNFDLCNTHICKKDPIIIPKKHIGKLNKTEISLLCHNADFIISEDFRTRGSYYCPDLKKYKVNGYEYSIEHLCNMNVFVNIKNMQLVYVYDGTDSYDIKEVTLEYDKGSGKTVIPAVNSAFYNYISDTEDYANDTLSPLLYEYDKLKWCMGKMYLETTKHNDIIVEPSMIFDTALRDSLIQNCQVIKVQENANKNTYILGGNNIIYHFSSEYLKDVYKKPVKNIKMDMLVDKLNTGGSTVIYFYNINDMIEYVIIDSVVKHVNKVGVDFTTTPIDIKADITNTINDIDKGVDVNMVDAIYQKGHFGDYIIPAPDGYNAEHVYVKDADEYVNAIISMYQNDIEYGYIFKPENVIVTLAIDECAMYISDITFKTDGVNIIFDTNVAMLVKRKDDIYSVEKEFVSYPSLKWFLKE